MSDKVIPPNMQVSYRCGYCGAYTDVDGNSIKASEIPDNPIEEIKVHGLCCAGNYSDSNNIEYVTREMAMDAGDPSLEGQPY